MLISPLFLWLGVGGVALAGWCFFALLEQKSRWSREAVHESTGVEHLRAVLNPVTDAFLALAADKMLTQAASTTDNPYLEQFRGATLTRYRELCRQFVAASYGHDALASSVLDAERVLSGRGLAAALKLPRVAKILEQPIEVKNIDARLLSGAVAAPKGAPALPGFQPEHLADCLQRVFGSVSAGLKEIHDSRARLNNRFAESRSRFAACLKAVDDLSSQGVSYVPLAARRGAVDEQLTKLGHLGENDPIGAFNSFAEVDSRLKAFREELESVSSLLKGLAGSHEQLKSQRSWVASVRASEIVCPWRSVNAEPPHWQLTNAGTNPDGAFLQCDTFLTQADAALASGNLKTAADARKEADNLCAQAVKQVKALFSAKESIDAQVPKVQIQLASLRGELSTVGNTPQCEEMARLVGTTCDAVEQRLREVHNFYQEEKFQQALALLTGAQGAEYGMPIAKLLEQARSLLKSLKEATKAAQDAQAKVDEAVRLAGAALGQTAAEHHRSAGGPGVRL